MVSKYDKNLMKIEISEGRRHYVPAKKTSLFGSETPRDAKQRNFIQRYNNTNNIISHADGKIVMESDIKQKHNIEDKRATLEELKSYDPWGKPGCGAPNTTMSDANLANNNRLKWELDQQIHQQNGNAKSSSNDPDDTYPGFGKGFGSGQQTKDSNHQKRRMSNGDESFDHSKNQSLESLGLKQVNLKNGDAPMDSESAYKNYEDAKAYADYLEREIQRLKIQQTGELDSLTKQDRTGSNYQYLQDYADKEYSYRDQEDPASELEKQAEYRARMRELERLRESNAAVGKSSLAGGQSSSQYNNNLILENNDYDQYHSQQDNQSYQSKSSSQHNQPTRPRLGSSTKNDFRQYTMEEYMNCRPSPMNPSHNKRTTLMGSETFGGVADHYSDAMPNSQKYASRNATHSNIFPGSDQQSSDSLQKSELHRIQAPFATD